MIIRIESTIVPLDPHGGEISVELDDAFDSPDIPTIVNIERANGTAVEVIRWRVLSPMELAVWYADDDEPSIADALGIDPEEAGEDG